MSKNTWNQPAPAVTEKPGPKPQPAEAQSPKEVADGTRNLLYSQGWCKWRCSALDDEVIIVTIDETIAGFPAGYPVYTVQELEELTRLDDHLLQVAHEAKKKFGARVEEL